MKPILDVHSMLQALNRNELPKLYTRLYKMWKKIKGQKYISKFYHDSYNCGVNRKIIICTSVGSEFAINFSCGLSNYTDIPRMPCYSIYYPINDSLCSHNSWNILTTYVKKQGFILTVESSVFKIIMSFLAVPCLNRNEKKLYSCVNYTTFWEPSSVIHASINSTKSYSVKSYNLLKSSSFIISVQGRAGETTIKQLP